MEDLVEKLQLAHAQQVQNVIEVEINDPEQAEKRIQELKSTFEELELVAAAATPVLDPSDIPRNPNPAVLTADFYGSYLVVLFLAHSLDAARFLWKRIAPETKQSSQLLTNVWEIGKALWKRDFTAAYAAMSAPWPNDLGQLIETLRLSTRESTAQLLSVAYATISFDDALLALGFNDEASLLAYCTSLEWEVSPSDKLIRPKALPRAPSHAAALQQLETLTEYVLHLEQSTLIKLP